MKPPAKKTQKQKNRALNFTVVKAQALFQRGLALHQQGILNEAKNFYLQALNLHPNQPDSLHLLGVIASHTKKFELAVELIGSAIAIAPNIAVFHSNLGLALEDLQRFEDALASYDKAIALKPDYADAYINRGNALKDLKRLDDAIASYEKAIALEPDHAEAYYNHGNAMLNLKRFDDALVSYEKVVAFKPDHFGAYNNRGLSLEGLKRLEDAVVSYDKAIAVKPDFFQVYINRGNSLKGLKRLEDALASYDKAIALKPDRAEAYYNRGHTLEDLKRLDEALTSYDKAITLKPDYKFLFGTLLHMKMRLCDWESFDSNLAKFVTQIECGEIITTPFPVLSLVDLPAINKLASKNYVEEKYPKSEFLGPITKNKRTDKIRIGYYSSDFHNHATAFLIAELFEAHDATKFELFGFSFGPEKDDEMRTRISSAFDKFIDVNKKSDRDVATLSRDFGIDIAIDLKGFTKDSRVGIFAERCAPIQVNYLGYPGTMAAEYIDYIIADKTLIRQEDQPNYTEKIVYLPNSYQINDAQRNISDRVFLKNELGLPEKGFVFCCFNNNYKILPPTFDSWMRILRAVEGSVLWLFEDNITAAENLRKESEKRGVDSCRLVFAKRMPLPEHLARHKLADLFIDTLPCNAHTTASDALWAGLPVLTCMGQSFASRVAASLLNAIELPELVTHTEEEYEALAISLAKTPEKFFEIKCKLEKNRLTTSLFDAKIFAKHIEKAYVKMYERHHADLPPEHIYVD